MVESKEMEGVSFVYHMFGSGETIHAIIKKYNHHNMPSKVLEHLMNEYNVLNDCNVPHLGNRVKIPLMYKENSDD